MQFTDTQIALLKGNEKKFRDTMADAILMEAGLIEHNPNPFTGYSIRELADYICYRNLIPPWSTKENKMAFMARVLNTTSDFTAILTNVGNKALLAGYDNITESYESWVNTIQIRDFKPATLARLGAFTGIANVSENGEFKEGKFETFTGNAAQLETYGAIFSVSRQVLINDDLGALTNVPFSLGQACKRFVNQKVYQHLVSNPVMADSVTCFHSDHDNVMSGALAVESLDEAFDKMSQQSSNSELLNLSPDTLLIPVSLKNKARIVVAAEKMPSEQSTGFITNVIADANLTASSNTAWYVLDSRHAPVYLAVLAREPNPIVENKQKFVADCLEMKVRYDFCVGIANFKSIVRGGQ